MGRSEKPSQVLICCSGGIDSSALIQYYLEKKFEVRGIHFDYDHAACKEENKALRAISLHYHIQVNYVELRPPIAKVNNKSGELIARNALFVLSSLHYLLGDHGLIGLGIHSGPPPYYDSSPAFVEHMQWILDGYFGGSVALDAPFMEFHKSDVIYWSRERHAPLDLTYSCQRGSMPPCGQCPSCLERKIYDL